jgi:hypothetical protein
MTLVVCFHFVFSGQVQYVKEPRLLHLGLTYKKEEIRERRGTEKEDTVLYE